MERYDSYKDSGVEWIGEIPSHWNKKRFSYSFNVQKGKIPKILSDENNTDSFPYLSMGVLRGEEPKEFSNENNLVVVNEGDIGLLWDGSNSGEIVKINQTGILSSTISHLSIKDENLNNDFSYYLLKFYENDFKNNTVGMGIPHVDGDHVKESKILIPPLSEQNEIVSFLDTKTSLIDSLIEKTQRKIELLKEKRTSLINEVVTKGLNPNVEMKDSGVEWIGEIPSGWEVVKLKRLTKVKRGSSPRPIDDPKYFDELGEYKWVRISDVSKSDRYLLETTETLSELGSSLSTKIYPNQLFLSIAGSVGKPMISKVKCCIHDGFVWFDGLKYNSEYLFYIFLLGSCFSGLGKMGTQLNLNTDTVGDIFIPLIDFELQSQIVSYLDEHTELIDKTISIEEKRIELLKEYRQSLISEVVTGKRKVVTHE